MSPPAPARRRLRRRTSSVVQRLISNIPSADEILDSVRQGQYSFMGEVVRFSTSPVLTTTTTTCKRGCGNSNSSSSSSNSSLQVQTSAAAEESVHALSILERRDAWTQFHQQILDAIETLFAQSHPNINKFLQEKQNAMDWISHELEESSLITPDLILMYANKFVRLMELSIQNDQWLGLRVDETALLSMTSTNGMATAMSIDQSVPHPSCFCKANPDLAVNFVSVRQQQQPESTETGGNNKSSNNLAESARQLEILFDLTGLLVANRSVNFFMDDRFDSFLDEPNRVLKQSIKNMMEDLPESSRNTPAFQKMEAFLREQMGLHQGEIQNREEDDIELKYSNWLTTTTPSEQQDSNSPHSIHHESTKINQHGDNDQHLEQHQQHQQQPNGKQIFINGSNSHNHHRNGSNDGAGRNNGKSSPGHVFCINGSVCDISCDAFLCPVAYEDSIHPDAIRGKVFKQWKERQMDSYPAFWEYMTNAKDDKENPFFTLQRFPEYPAAAVFRDWPWKEFEKGSRRKETTTSTSLVAPIPLLVAGNVIFDFGKIPTAMEHLDALSQTVKDVLQVAHMELTKHQPKPRCNRERYLIAIPFVGTGGSGGVGLTGQICVKLLAVLQQFAEEYGIDCVLCAADEATYAHAQQSRYRQLLQNKLPCFNAVSLKLKEEAMRLANLSTSGKLSLFLGAGVSVASGLPTWFQLLDMLEDKFTPTGDPEERSVGIDCKWDPLDMADALERICATRKDRDGVHMDMKHRISELLTTLSRNPGLLLYLLLALKPTSIVTQNYDQLIERATACRNVADPTKQEGLSVIPYAPLRAAPRWLLKMHGCCSVPRDIVVTSQDYDIYHDGHQEALSGLVQANLMTSHIVFVGYSLTDPNYLRILQEVRQALHPELAQGCDEGCFT